MPRSINIYPFPFEHKLKEEKFEDYGSEETKYTYKDSCDLIAQLDENIKNFMRKNQEVQEKEKKIIIKGYKSEDDIKIMKKKMILNVKKNILMKMEKKLKNKLS